MNVFSSWNICIMSDQSIIGSMCIGMKMWIAKGAEYVEICFCFCFFHVVTTLHPFPNNTLSPFDGTMDKGALYSFRWKICKESKLGYLDLNFLEFES